MYPSLKNQIYIQMVRFIFEIKSKALYTLLS